MNTGPGKTSRRVVFDTNVLVSAALSDGPPYEVLSLAENGGCVSVTSPGIVAELRDVLTRERLPFTDDQVDEFVGKILSVSTVVEPEIELEVIDDDPDDDKIVECAVAADVDCIVSGDSHLTELDSYEGLTVYTPAEFLEQLG